MLTFKQKRKYKFLATLFTTSSIVFCVMFLVFMVSVFNNWFGFEIGSVLYRIYALSGFMGLLMLIIMSYLFSNYYQTLRYDYLRKIKTYRLNRHFRLILVALKLGEYDLAIDMYNKLIPDNTDQGTILYGAFLFVLQNSKKPEHIELAKQHTANVLNKFNFNNIFK
jgi:hypothetical protein